MCTTSNVARGNAKKMARFGCGDGTSPYVFVIGVVCLSLLLVIVLVHHTHERVLDLRRNGNSA